MEPLGPAWEVLGAPSAGLGVVGVLCAGVPVCGFRDHSTWGRGLRGAWASSSSCPLAGLGWKGGTKETRQSTALLHLNPQWT